MCEAGFVQELGPVDDQTAWEVLSGAQALIFPSLAEGFGLPALEAARLRVPCIATRLPVFEEVLGNIPIYVEDAALYPWRETITRLMDKKEQEAERNRICDLASRNGLPTWEEHFNTVLRSLN